MRRCIETRQCAGYVRRRYRLPDGSTRTTYELGEPDIDLEDVKALIQRRLNRTKRLSPGALSKVPAEKRTAVVNALAAGWKHADIAQALKISTKTIQVIKRSQQ